MTAKFFILILRCKNGEKMSKKKVKVESWGTGRPDFTAAPPTYINKKEWFVHHWLGILGIILTVLFGLLGIFLLSN